jgi:hypothetical protein
MTAPSYDLIFDVFRYERVFALQRARTLRNRHRGDNQIFRSPLKINVTAHYKLAPSSNRNRVSLRSLTGQNKNHFGKWTAAIINCQVQKRRATTLFAGPFVSPKPFSQFEI